MGFIRSAIVFAALICYVLAAKTHSIPLRHTDSPLKAMLKQNVHPSVIAAMLTAETNQSLPEPLKRNYMNTEYFGEILLGTPGQTFLVSFDTTWVDSWIPSANCPSTSVPCLVHNKYNEKRSRSSIKTPYEFRVELGNSDLAGNIYYDQLILNGVNVTNQPFAAVSQMPWTFTYSKFDGIFGMGFGEYGKITPVMWNLKKQKIIDQMVFSFHFNSDGGSMVLGGVDPAHYKGNFTFANVVNSGYPEWMIKVDNMTLTRNVNNTSGVCKTGCNAIMSTGGNPIYGPAKEIAAINKFIKAKKTIVGDRYSVSCSDVSKLPNITISIGNEPFILEGRDYIQKIKVGMIMDVCLSAFLDNYDVKDDSWYLGGAFMSKYYTTFDMEHGKIGFATAK